MLRKVVEKEKIGTKVLCPEYLVFVSLVFFALVFAFVSFVFVQVFCICPSPLSFFFHFTYRDFKFL